MIDEYYNGPLVGFTDKEIIETIGQAVLDTLKREGMEIVWRKK